MSETNNTLNKEETVSNTGIVINKKEKVLITSKVDKTFITRSQLKAAKENNKKARENWKKANKINKTDSIWTKGRKAIFVFSCIIFAFIFVWLVCYCYSLATVRSEYGYSNLAKDILFGIIPIIAGLLIPIFIISLVVFLKQLKFAKDKQFINKMPCFINLAMSLLTIIIFGLILGFYISYCKEPHSLFSLPSFQLSTLIGIVAFIVTYLMTYALVFSTNDMNVIKLISLFKRQLKTNIMILGFVEFVFGLTYSVFGLSSAELFDVAAFYFGRSLIALFICGLFIMAGNIATLIIFDRKKPEFIAQIVIYGLIFILSFVFTIISGCKFTPSSNPNNIHGGASVCMLINTIVVLGGSVYTIINNNINGFDIDDKYNEDQVKKNMVINKTKDKLVKPTKPVDTKPTVPTTGSSQPVDKPNGGTNKDSNLNHGSTK